MTVYATRQQLLARLDALEIAYCLHEHPAVFTVEEARVHCAHLPGGHFKNLFLRSKKKHNWLVVLRDDATIDLQQLGEILQGGRLSFASRERLWEHLGVVPGSVTPLALINDPEQRVNVVFDERVLDADPVNFHPLENTATLALNPRDLLAFIRSLGHEPRLVTMPLVPPPSL